MSRLLGALRALLPLLLSLPALAAAPAELRLAASGSWKLPWGAWEGQRLVGGIHHDIAQALARRLGRPLRVVRLLPTKAHFSAQDRDADLRCGLDPSWVPEPALYHWSLPLFDSSDLLVAAAGQPPLAALAELPQGARVGTVRGYHYPTLQARLDAGELRREDGLSQQQVLEKLVRGRSDYAVVGPQALSWWRRQTGFAPGQRLAGWSLRVQDSSYHCGVPSSAQTDPRPILAALQALRDAGEIERILARYR